MYKFDITDELVSIVSAILYHYDPAGLAKLGVPEDEYDSEAYLILELVQNHSGFSRLVKLIYDVFEHSFSKEHTLEIHDTCYEYIAKQIDEIIKNEMKL